MPISIVRSFHRWLRRKTVRGEAIVYDFELMALACLSNEFSIESGLKLRAQIQRYDRIDRSEDWKHQILIDDDSDYQRSNWPSSITFANKKLVNAGIIRIRHNDWPKTESIKCRADFIYGCLAGFEFTFSQKAPRELCLSFSITDLGSLMRDHTNSYHLVSATIDESVLLMN
jgi:hypothetical protein